MQRACVLHAHLLYLYRNVPQEEFTAEVVVSMLTSQIHLTTHYTADLVQIGRSIKDKSKGGADSGWGVPDTEVFSLFQAQRANIMNFLDENHEQRSTCLEQIVRNVAKSGAGKDLKLQARFWRSLDGRHCVGRYVPDMNPRTKEQQEEADRTRDLTRPVQSIDTEVNLQLGTFTLETSRIQVLDERIADMYEFQEVFGEGANKMHCAPVKDQVNRYWVRLIGIRHDLQVWKPDQRPPCNPAFNRKYDRTKSESWIVEMLEPDRKSVV